MDVTVLADWPGMSSEMPSNVRSAFTVALDGGAGWYHLRMVDKSGSLPFYHARSSSPALRLGIKIEDHTSPSASFDDV